MKTCARVVAAALWIGLAALSAQAQTVTATANPAASSSELYIAFGERPGIAALMDDFVVRLKADQRTAPFFEKTNLPELAKHLTDQICALSGGPCVYRGAPMKIVHVDIEIRRADFNALVEVLQDSMDARGIAFRTQNRLLARLAWMHRAIVNMPDPR